jgi:hypothetical protein
MIKKDAVEAIEHLLYKADKIKTKNDYYTWLNRCRIELETVFGKGTTYVTQFEDFNRYNDDWNVEGFKQLLTEYHGHLHRHGPPVQDAIILDPKTATMQQVAHEFGRIPFWRFLLIVWPLILAIVAVGGTSYKVGTWIQGLKADFTTNEYRNENEDLRAQKAKLTSDLAKCQASKAMQAKQDTAVVKKK